MAGRKSTGRTTTHTRIPKKYKAEIERLVTSIKETDLEPLPYETVALLAKVLFAKKRLDQGIILKSLSEWRDRTRERLGAWGAVVATSLTYGGEFAYLVFEVPPEGEWWEVLGVSFDATAKEIKKAYYDKAKIWHPDVAPDAPRAIMQRLVQAYKEAGS